jgi:hypothetical protein
MSTNEFWYGDPRLLGVYQKAFIRNQSYNAWLQGFYNSTAFGIVLHNSFAKKGTPPQEFPKWKDPICIIEKPKITHENLEEEFRQSQKNQNLWLHNILHKK